LAAFSGVYEHFSYHAGQIIYLTKLKRGKDLRFTRLPRRTSFAKTPCCAVTKRFLREKG